MGSGQWASLTAWPAASHVDKGQGRGKQLPVCSRLPLGAVLLEEFGIVPSEGKGLALKFGRAGFQGWFFFFLSFSSLSFLKAAFPRQSHKIKMYKYFPRVPSSGNPKEVTRLASDLDPTLVNKNKTIERDLLHT